MWCVVEVSVVARRDIEHGVFTLYLKNPDQFILYVVAVIIFIAVFLDNLEINAKKLILISY